MNGIEAREEEATAAGHAGPDTTQEEREHPETLEGMGQSANGTVPAGKNMSGTGEPGSGDPDSEESNNEGSSNEESGSEDIEEANWLMTNRRWIRATPSSLKESTLPL